MNNTFKLYILNNLEKQVINLADKIVTLESQGYSVNITKQQRLNWGFILINQVTNIKSFTKEQETKIINIYNKLF